MSRKLRIDRKAATAAAFMVGFGLFVAIEASSYTLGTPRRMNAGFYPFLLGCLAVVVGVGIFIFEGLVSYATLRRQEDETGASLDANPDSHKQGSVEPPVPWRPLLFVTLAVAAFASLLEGAGLIAATVALVVIGSLSVPWRGLVKVGVLAAATAAGIWLIFVVGLGLPFKLW